MKAAVIHELKKPLVIKEVAMPEVPAGYALIKVRAAGVCGTELHYIDGLLASGLEDFIPGHEIAGDVVQVEDNPYIKVGDRVSVYNMLNCGDCEYCRQGRDSLCDHPHGQIGFNTHGGFAEYVAAPINNLIPIADNVPYTYAAVLACSGMTAVHAIRLAGIKLLDTVVIDGVGGVGLIVGQVAKLAGAKVFAIADTAEKAELAKQVFADDAVVTKDYTNVVDELKALTGGKGVDFFFELVGTKASSTAGMQSLAKMGTFVIIGYTQDKYDLDPLMYVCGENRLIASVAAAKKDLEAVLKLCADGKINVTIQEELALEDVNIAIDRLRARTSLGRNVIVFN